MIETIKKKNTTMAATAASDMALAFPAIPPAYGIYCNTYISCGEKKRFIPTPSINMCYHSYSYSRIRNKVRYCLK